MAQPLQWHQLRLTHAAGKWVIDAFADSYSYRQERMPDACLCCLVCLLPQFNQARANNFQASLKRVMQTNSATKLKHVVSHPLG